MQVLSELLPFIRFAHLNANFVIENVVPLVSSIPTLKDYLFEVKSAPLHPFEILCASHKEFQKAEVCGFYRHVRLQSS